MLKRWRRIEMRNAKQMEEDRVGKKEMKRHGDAK